MSTNSVITRFATSLGVEPEKLLGCLKKVVFKKDVSNEEAMAFLLVADKYQLNPFMREIYPILSQDGMMLPAVSVDGWYNLIHRQANLDGIAFHFADEEITLPQSRRIRNWDKSYRDYSYSVTAPRYCECVLYLKNFAHPIAVREYLSECIRATDNWERYPRRMLRHRALIQCARAAFSFGNIYDAEEVDVADVSEINVVTANTVAEIAQSQATKVLPAKEVSVAEKKSKYVTFESDEKRQEYVTKIIERLKGVDALGNAQAVFAQRLNEDDLQYAMNCVKASQGEAS